MKVIMKILVGLAITSTALAEGGRGKLLFIDGYRADAAQVRSTHSIQSIERRGSTLKVILEGGKLLEIPLINEHEAKQAESYGLRGSQTEVYCLDPQNLGVCEELSLLTGIHVEHRNGFPTGREYERRMSFQVERTKLFPEIYSKIENLCRSGDIDNELLLGKASRVGPNRVFVSFYEGHTFLQGPIIRGYSIRLNEVTYLNNTIPFELWVWMFVNKDKTRIVMLDRCQTIGEIPYKERR